MWATYQKLHEQGLVSVLRTLHDELDEAVLQAYGWQDLGPVPWADEAARQAWTDALLERLVALNARRAAEEAAGTIRWLRPEFQDLARRQAATATVNATPTQTDPALPGIGEPDSTDPDSAGAAEATPATAAPPRASPGPLPCPSRCAPWPMRWRPPPLPCPKPRWPSASPAAALGRSACRRSC